MGVRPAEGQSHDRGKPGHIASLSVPDHKEITKGTLRSLIRSSGLSVEEFVALLD